MRDGSGKWRESRWRSLLSLTLEALDSIEDRHPATKWSFGGGTALAIDLDHRVSYDIDAFLESTAAMRDLVPQRNEVTRRICWDPDHGVPNFQWPGHYLKLVVADEGEIDFLNASSVVDDPSVRDTIQGREIDRERPCEVIAKKIRYRGSRFKARDVFDLAFVTWLAPAELVPIGECGLITVEHLDRLQARVEAMSGRFAEDALVEINPTEAGMERMIDAPTYALGAIETLRGMLRRPTMR